MDSENSIAARREVNGAACGMILCGGGKLLLANDLG